MRLEGGLPVKEADESFGEFVIPSGVRTIPFWDRGRAVTDHLTRHGKVLVEIFLPRLSEIIGEKLPEVISAFTDT